MDSFEPAQPSPSNLEAGASANGTVSRVPAGRIRSLWLLTGADLLAVSRSWLCRGFFLVSALLTTLQLKGMQADEQVASAILEAVFVTYLLVWMHGVVFIAGGALSREADCLNDAILSRGTTRGEYMAGKLLSRCVAVTFMLGIVLIPAGFWAIRQDELVRTDTGFATSAARNAKVEAWEPVKIFARADATLSEVSFEVGDEVKAGDVLALLDDRQLFDAFEARRRAEEDALNQVTNARRRYEDARRGVAQAEDALARAERALTGKDLLSRLEQADRETEVRSRKRDLKNAETLVRTAQDAITAAERVVETARAEVREARKKLGYASITAPISGYVTERPVQAGQPIGLGTHLLTVAPLDDYEIRVPVYRFEEFKRLEQGLKAFITIEETEFEGLIERLGAMTEEDRWGRQCNFVMVRFRGNGTLGLLGQDADVRLVLPPREEAPDRMTALLNTLTGKGEDDVETQTASVTPFWMLVGVGKVLGCACLLVTLSLFVAALTRSALIAVLSVTGLWHVSNLLFDFAGLPELSYLEMIRTMDKVLGGVANPTDELTTLLWLAGLALSFGGGALGLFILRDPPK